MIRRTLLALALGSLAAGGALAQAKSPQDDLKARHQAMLAAFNKADMAALKMFYAPEYRYEELNGRKIPLAEFLKGLELMLKQPRKLPPDKATLSNVVIKGDEATVIETRSVEAGGDAGPVAVKTDQTWRRVGGLWKLALEKEVRTPRKP
jgi:hypothetical protein